MTKGKENDSIFCPRPNNGNLLGLTTERNRAVWPAIATESCYPRYSKNGSLSCSEPRESHMK